MTDSPLNKYCRKLLNDLEGYAPQNALPVMVLTMKVCWSSGWGKRDLHFPDLDLWLEDAASAGSKRPSTGKGTPKRYGLLAGAQSRGSRP